MNPGHIIEWMLAVITVTWLATFAYGGARHFCRDWRRARRVVAGTRQDTATRLAASIKAVGDDALALICDPCNGKSGKCRCASKCGDWLCGAADTGIGGWTDAEMAFLRGERETPGG